MNWSNVVTMTMLPMVRMATKTHCTTCWKIPRKDRVVFDRVFCCQTDAAEQDEEEDEVCEDVVVDDLVA
ncbi:hypothetical protein EYF80_024579 [Liparis tanakae]|uniref:Uncharacterized protein n=1 Tax=Liparis tanakae TaxID=230148 RepID=A0A4Z2HJY1_9TELE|nr:hypothetical protein EYF80_024579 [Liparis tanakae]